MIGGTVVSINDELLAQLGDPGIREIAGLLDTDTDTARQVVEAASGTIVGGLARSADNPDGAHALRAALDDHVDADPFTGDVASLERDGQSILGHVFGGEGTEQAAAGLSQFAGLDSNILMKLLPLLAPMVMSILANRASQQNMDAGAVADDLNKEQSAVPGDLEDLLGGLLGGIFGGGGTAIPHQTRTEPQDTEPQAAPGTSNPDW